MSPSDVDVSFKIGEEAAACMSFSPDSRRLLVSLEDEVQMWNIETRQKDGQIPSSGSLYTSFSDDGELIVVGNSKRTILWEATGTEIMFDSAVSVPQTLSLANAKHIFRTCGPSSLRLWPSLFRTASADSCPPESVTNLNEDNIFNFVSVFYRPSDVQFCHEVFVQNFAGVIAIFKLGQ